MVTIIFEAHSTSLDNEKQLSSSWNDVELSSLGEKQVKNSVPYDQFEYRLPICLVVGHETNGVSKEVLQMVDGVVEIPMFGINKSLNVMVSLGIVLYKAIERVTKLV